MTVGGSAAPSPFPRFTFFTKSSYALPDDSTLLLSFPSFALLKFPSQNLAKFVYSDQSVEAVTATSAVKDSSLSPGNMCVVPTSPSSSKASNSFLSFTAKTLSRHYLTPSNDIQTDDFMRFDFDISCVDVFGEIVAVGGGNNVAIVRGGKVERSKLNGEWL